MLAKLPFKKAELFFFLAFSFLIFSCNPDENLDPNVPLPALELSNVSYGSDMRQTMDVFLPGGRSMENTPLLIYIHGGAWIDGSKDEFAQVKPLLDQAFPEYAYVAINYRLFDFLSRQNPFPTQENDVMSAIEYIISQQDEWNVGNQIVIAGASAGGHLALLHGFKNPEIGNIQAVIAFFPPTDLAELFNFNSLTALGLTEILQGTPENKPQAYLESSPVNYINSNSVPTIFFHGTADTVVPISQSDLLKSKLQENSVPHEFRRIEGQGHGFTPSTNVELIQAASAFVRAN